MNDKFTLSVGLAHELEMAMSRNGGWNAQLVKRLCEGNNLSVVRHLIITADALVGAKSTMSQATLMEGINPVGRTEPWNRPNRKFKYVRPAIMTGAEVTELLRYFSGEHFRAMSLLLVTVRNEPYCELRSGDPEQSDPPIRFNKYAINQILRKIKVGGKRFNLSGYIASDQGGLESYQLWEIELVKDSSSASVPAHLGYSV